MLDIVRELERRDAEATAAIDAAVSLERELELLRARAADAAELLARLPAERERADRAVEAAAAETEAARAAVARANDDDTASARAALDTAEHALARAEALVDALAEDAGRAEAERARVDVDALATAERLAGLERMHAVEPPQPGLAGALDWSSRARAAVFVVRSGREAERERIVREAGELGASLLGEPVYTVKALVDRLL